jgi:integrase
VRTKTFGTEKAAKRYAMHVEVDKDRGQYRAPDLGRETLAEHFADYISSAPLAPSTRVLQEGHWRNHIAPVLGRRRLSAITEHDVEVWSRGLQANPPTRDACTRLLKRLLNVAAKQNKILRSPAAPLPSRTAPRKEMAFLDVADVERLVEATEPRWQAFVLLLAFGGFRIGELAALRTDRIDWLRRVIRVESQLSEVAGTLEDRETKTRRKRAVTMPESVMQELAEHVRVYPPKIDGYIFTGRDGGRVRRTLFLRRVFKPALKRAGLPQMRVHDLRHTAVALMIQAGGHLAAIQARAGHSSIKTTIDVYGHLVDGLDAELAANLDVLRKSAAGLLLENTSAK